uniref:5'-nucleotidase n=1 Tax=Lepeophtheirus salmonis TaxID=72036 RepID=D3PG26_LEPSM|nr:Cytosolic 5-nucleotidase III-like protein A [Lepeophtheirus salmonis]
MLIFHSTENPTRTYNYNSSTNPLQVLLSVLYGSTRMFNQVWLMLIITNTLTFKDKMDVLKDYEHKSNNLRFRNIDELNGKLKKMTQDSRESLQVITDFDYTLSKYHDGDGVRLGSSWFFVENSPLLPLSYREKTKKLHDTYHPIEVDPKLSIEEKIPHMEEWYRKIIILITEYITDEKHFKEAIKDISKLQLRDGAPEFIRQLYNNHIPLLVFSAGFGEIIKNLLIQRDLLHSEYTKMHSNFLEFDQTSKKIIGVKEPVIHVFNKNGGAYIASTPPKETEEIRKRKNILLLGDSMGDLSMSHGIDGANENESTIIKIGFLNHNIDDFIDRYIKEYDVVIIDDQTMNFPLHILRLFKI